MPYDAAPPRRRADAYLPRPRERRDQGGAAVRGRVPTVSTSWVAGVVRAKALARRRVGAGAARALATRPTLAEAVAALNATPYGHDVHPDARLVEAQHAVGATLLWNLRVLAGWLPRGGADVIRLLAAAFEVANLDEHLARLYAEPAGPSYPLGTLDTAWVRLSTTTTLAEIGDVLSTSSWRLRGATTRRDVQLGLRLAWSDAVAARLPEAAAWARAAAALLVLRETCLEQRTLSPSLARRSSVVLGGAFVDLVAAGQTDVHVLQQHLAGDTRWVLAGLDRVEDLWRAEVTWWHRVEHDGFALLRGSSYDQRPVVGAVAVLAVDAWRTRAALEAAARGGAEAREVFDGVA